MTKDWTSRKQSTLVRLLKERGLWEKVRPLLEDLPRPRKKREFDFDVIMDEQRWLHFELVCRMGVRLGIRRFTAIKYALQGIYNQDGAENFRKRYGASVNAVTHRIYGKLKKLGLPQEDDVRFLERSMDVLKKLGHLPQEDDVRSLERSMDVLRHLENRHHQTKS